MNGTVLIFFMWITDVMFGPVFGSPTRPADRVFPTHFLACCRRHPRTPYLIDATGAVSRAYGVLGKGMHPGLPG